MVAPMTIPLSQFQSTHPLRGATALQSTPILQGLYFNPRTPCVVRQMKARGYGVDWNFNPRTPCGVRHTRIYCDFLTVRFQSTHPLRGATFISHKLFIAVPVISIHAPLAGCDEAHLYLARRKKISIHAPLAGCDAKFFADIPIYDTNFNPRTPCGVRRNTITISSAEDIFQSTHPLRGATFLFVLLSFVL